MRLNSGEFRPISSTKGPAPYKEERNIFMASTNLKFPSSSRLLNNVEKGRFLEDPTRDALERMACPFLDFSHVYNFLGSEKCVPEFVTPQHLVEAKNWNCKKYYIGMNKAVHEINERAINFPHKQKILIISKPKWRKGIKEYLLSCGWTIIELGYVVMKRNQSKARSDIMRALRPLLGYVHRNSSSCRSCCYVYCGCSLLFDVVNNVDDDNNWLGGANSHDSLFESHEETQMFSEDVAGGPEPRTFHGGGSEICITFRNLYGDYEPPNSSLDENLGVKYGVSKSINSLVNKRSLIDQ